MRVGELFDLTGKVAVVTGGSRGLGKEIAVALGEAGARIAIIARRRQWLNEAAEELRQLHIDCLPLESDIGKPEDIRALVERTIAKWGKIDILVNNAGITWGAPPEEMPLDKWESVLQTNATGTFLCCQGIGREMIKKCSGVILNVASTTGLLAVDPRIMQAVGYQASKGAIIALTRQLAAEWCKYNIRVNAVAPGFFNTRMTRDVVDRAGKEIAEQILMGRLGKEKEMKGVVVFLVSEASSYITGQVINVDGGMSAW